MRYGFSHLSERELRQIAGYIEKFGIFKVTDSKELPGVHLIIDTSKSAYVDKDTMELMHQRLAKLGVGSYQGNRFQLSSHHLQSLLPQIFAYAEYDISREVFALALEYLNLRFPEFSTPSFTDHLPHLDWLVYTPTPDMSDAEKALAKEKYRDEVLYWLRHSQGDHEIK